ncbi:protein kinase [Nocardia sp. NPDC059239]|uniref:protein kinase domain-containing protein n=1 Tax=unclassified Nocardia TaxID=2637762 RepID=UPI003690311C
MNPAAEDPSSTQRQATLGIEAELEAEGFEDAELIGRGGFGAVYRCAERALERQVAVKVLRPESDGADLERFLREQRSLGRLSAHPNIVTVLHVDVTATGRPYLVMPFYRRGSLQDAIADSGPLDYAAVLRLGVKLAGALETAHRAGILHRDVKPGNVLLTDYGQPELCDFGIAHMADGAFETGSGEITGSPAFTAPEVLFGQPSTVRSDIYSLGATLFSAYTGHAAFERREGEDVVAQFIRISRHSAIPVEDLPEDLGRLISDAMARQPEDRPASARQFGDALRELQRHNGFTVDEMSIPDSSPEFDEARSRDSDGSRRAVRRPRHDMPALVTPNTRFRPPHPLEHLIRRPRLGALLRPGERPRLILIHAPAGFGKSSVATQLAEQLFHDGAQVAWLTTDTDDNNVVTFCAHVLEALRRTDPSLGGELSLALEEAGSRAERFVLTSLINELHERKHHVALVIDDWHQVTSESSRAALRFLLERGCHHLQLIVTTRTRAGLPLSALRVHNELVEIDSTALRFTAEETGAFLARCDGIDLASADIERLTESTEGWIAALQLAALSLRQHGRSAELLHEISGRHHALGEFLAENVLDSLDPALVDFMMDTSITRRICGDLATALTGTDRGQALLENVEERNLFLRRIDETGEWFRYHYLFADYLQRRLERDRPERLPVLHAAAAAWFSEHQMVQDAVTHALASGNDRWAAELVEEAGIALLEQGQMATILALTDLLPPEVSAHRPHLLVTITLANLGVRRDAAARETLDRVYAALESSQLDPYETAKLRIQCQVIEGVAAMLQDRSEGIADLIETPLRDPDSFEPWFAAGAAVIAAFIDLSHFRFDAVKACRERAAVYFETSTGPLTQTYAYCLSALAAREQLDIRTAEYFLRKVMQLAMTGRRTSGLAARMAGALLGELRYEHNDVDEANRLIDAAHEFAATAGTVDVMIAVYVTGAKVKAALGDHEEAAQRLDDGMRIAADLDLPRLTAAIEGERIRQGIARVAEPPPSLGPPADSPAEPGTAELTRDIQSCNLIRRSLALGTARSVTEATTVARALTEKLVAQHRPHALITVKLLLARCLSMSGDTSAGRGLVAEVVEECGRVGLIRPLLDEGPEVWELLDTGVAPVSSHAHLFADAIAVEKSRATGNPSPAVLPKRGQHQHQDRPRHDDEVEGIEDVER